MWNNQGSQVALDCQRGTVVNIDALASKFYSYPMDELVVLGYDALNLILSSRSLQVLNEDWLLNRIVSLGPDFHGLLRHIRLEFLSASELQNFLKAVSVYDIDELLWGSITARLCAVHDESTLRQRVKDHWIDSPILHKWRSLPIRFEEFHGKNFELLYRGSRDGFTIADFHRCCDEQPDTVLVIETKNRNVFGGYRPLAWKPSDGYKTDSSMKTFCSL
jgi:hypothetical protein